MYQKQAKEGTLLHFTFLASSVNNVDLFNTDFLFEDGKNIIEILIDIITVNRYNNGKGR